MSYWTGGRLGTPERKRAGVRPRAILPFANWSVPRTVAGAFGGLALGAAVLPLPVLILDPGIHTYAGMIAAQALLGVAFLVTAVMVAWGEGGLAGALGRLGIRRFRRRAIVQVLLAYLVYVIALGLYALAAGSPDQKDIARELGLDEGVLRTALSVLLIAVLAPVSEELFFRGMVFGGLRGRMAFLPAALLSAAFFGSLHLPTGPNTVPPLILFGFLLAWVYERSGSLWPAIVLHLINNSLALALAL